MSIAWSTLRPHIVSAVGCLRSGTATGGAAAGATLIDTTYRTDKPGTLEGATVIFTAGTAGNLGLAKARSVKSFDQATQTVTPWAAFASQVASGDTYDLYLPPFTPDDYRRALNMAVQSSWSEYPVPLMDTSLTVLANDYDYTVPTKFARVDRVAIQPSTGNTTQEYVDVPKGEWEIEWQAESALLRFAIFQQTGRLIKIEGAGRIQMNDGATPAVAIDLVTAETHVILLAWPALQWMIERAASHVWLAFSSPLYDSQKVQAEAQRRMNNAAQIASRLPRYQARSLSETPSFRRGSAAVWRDRWA